MNCLEACVVLGKVIFKLTPKELQIVYRLKFLFFGIALLYIFSCMQ